ncbi:MAG: formylglycine-generating enzyme family protein [Planctomycetota bacterium]|jgi:serine/threonine-protein kinase
MKEKVQKIKEFVWQKYVDYTQPTSSDIQEQASLEVLEHHYRTVDPEEDPEIYYLGILLFELAFQNEDLQNFYLAKAKTIFERYRTTSGETDWDVIEDRLEEIEDSLSSLGPDERAEIFSRVDRDVPTTGLDLAPQEAIAVVEGMVFVPSGPYLAGPKNEEKEVEGFYIDIFPVTNREYRKFIDARGYRPPKFWAEQRMKEPDAPVVGVSWYDADKYSAWAGKKLPSAEQWEKAARGLEGRIYPWGNEIDEAKANFGHVDGEDLVCPVEKHEENHSVFGARDLAGNVWEWTRDWDDIEIDMKIIRGGSWADPPQFLRCDRHLYANPKDKYDNIGFRCVRPAE